MINIKTITLSFLFIFAYCLSYAQINIIGHNQINNEKLIGTQITVRDEKGILQTINTKAKSDFLIKLNFGKSYKIYFQNNLSPVMFMEVIANNIPEEKQHINMTHEFNVNFYYKNDEDVDTTVFGKSFYKILFDGNSKMTEDTSYNYAFERKIIKSKIIVDNNPNIKQVELPVIIGGRAVLNNNMKLPLVNKTILLLDKKGLSLRSTKTNRFGAFAFTGVKFSEIGKIKVETKENDLSSGIVSIMSTSEKSVVTSKCNNGACDMPLSAEQAKMLIDNNFVSNIGGKLVLSSPNQKKFYANKTVYLSNKRNTIIKKTTTNVLGTFVFEDIKPDNTYFIGVDAKEIGGGEKIDFLNKDDKLVANFDTLAAARKSIKINTDYNTTFNDISIADEEMKMNVKAKIFGDNINNPLGKLKILLLNDAYQVIDSAFTDDFGTFKFKYLPFLKRFFLSAENTDNILDVFNNILVYSNEDNLLKVMTHEKGSKFLYKPFAVELSKLKEIEIDDPWLDLYAGKKSVAVNKTIIENILFETNKFDLLPQAKEILDKIILVLNTNKKIKLELSAHTDSKGNDADNLKLSQLRAKTVRLYITNAGIEESRLISVGYGEAKPINKCANNVPCTEIEYAQNRRVEFKILEE
jgi:outer membrane protein OmpA-like peptidoglycan-associated protein